MTIIYQNLVYVSTLSGLFAISISAIVLLLMMVLAKQIVQIALILTITLSFAWGTMGIGLSPKKVVPATGFIALALSVAYAIVVWERCKFHGANLHTSLTGLRANPGALFVAFLCQFLALGWSIYYTYVAVGVYDAVEAGDIELSSSSMRIGLYSALGVSYYWTLQVFLVSLRYNTSVRKYTISFSALVSEYCPGDSGRRYRQLVVHKRGRHDKTRTRVEQGILQIVFLFSRVYLFWKPIGGSSPSITTNFSAIQT